MRIYLFVIIAVLSIFAQVLWGADKPSVFTQKDFAKMILQHFSWDSGLPKEAADRDYYIILEGKRTFRYEAENIYNPETDRVTVREFPLFGAFTGKGWIFGVSDTTSSTFTLFLPVSGEYEFKAVIKGNGFVWNINDKDYRSDSKSGNFRETDIAKLQLKAGIITITLTIPPEGAIDSFSFTAPDRTPIRPFNGWHFKEPLTAASMAEVGIAIKNSYSMLPDAGDAASPKEIAVSGNAVLPPTAAATNISYLGSFSSPAWVRADYRGATLQIPLKIADAGYYGIVANIMGDTILGNINNVSFKLIGKPYLDKLNLGLYRLEAGDNTLTVVLPPTGGIDAVILNRKSSTPDSFLRLLSVSGPADRLIGADEAAEFLKGIQVSSPNAK